MFQMLCFGLPKEMYLFIFLAWLLGIDANLEICVA